MSGDKPGYIGWLTNFVENTRKIGDGSSGLVSVPLKITSPGGVQEDTATLVAGMLGFTLHEGDVPVVQPFQG